jgi:hypothetical protein
MFCTGQAAPRYPGTITVELRRLLRLPDHHPHRPEPVMSGIPQTIWPLAVAAALIPCTRPELRGTSQGDLWRKRGVTPAMVASTGRSRDSAGSQPFTWATPPTANDAKSR